MAASLISSRYQHRDPLAASVALPRVARLHAATLGAGPCVVLLHGTGCTHSTWQTLMSELATDFFLVAPDLPGHGESENLGKGHFSPASMAQAVAQLLNEMQVEPDIIIGHSAGAAIAVRGLVDGVLKARQLVLLNPALKPFPGLQGLLFSGSAKVLARLPLISEVIASRGRDQRAVARLLKDIGSELPTPVLRKYQQLFSDPNHIRAVLMMMAEWDLYSLASALPRLDVATLLLGGLRDGAVPAQDVRDVAEQLPNAAVELINNGGHLLHEEQPQRIAKRLQHWLSSTDGKITE